MSAADTRQQIMHAARLMVQARGYNALSFRELAKEVGIKSASIHYHFPTKGDLGGALARRYNEELSAHLEQLLAISSDPGVLLERYTDIFRQPLMNGNRMCMAGIMAAEYDDLPQDVRDEFSNFTDINVRWLSQVLACDEARSLAIFSAMEGAQLIARGRGDLGAYDRAIAAYRVAGLIP